MLAIQAEEGEGSGHPSEPQPPPSTAQLTNEDPIPKIESPSHQKTQTPRQALHKVIELPQTSEPIPNIANEVVYEDWDDKGIGAGGSPRCQKVMGVPLLRLGFTLVTPTKVSSQEDQPEDQLGVLSVANILVDAAKKNVIYTRRRRVVSTGSGEVSTASRLFSIAEESVSTAGSSMLVSTAGMVQEVSIPSPVATKDKGKAIMQESE
ncbi:hypothetical protein Tco_0612670 [Tanacetum coccineum]